MVGRRSAVGRPMVSRWPADSWPMVRLWSGDGPAMVGQIFRPKLAPTRRFVGRGRRWVSFREGCFYSPKGA
eukprot:8873256-Lingulodinium_polyedra.AAC.1